MLLVVATLLGMLWLTSPIEPTVWAPNAVSKPEGPYVPNDRLPGFPDNVRYSPSRHGFWVAIGSPRKPEIDALANLPNVRRSVAALPKGLQPKPARFSYVLLVNETGKPVEPLQHDAPESCSPIACATEHDGWLYLGSFAREANARFKLASP